MLPKEKEGIKLRILGDAAAFDGGKEPTDTNGLGYCSSILCLLD